MLTSTTNTTLLHNITIGLSPSNDTPWLLCDILVNNTVWHEAHSVMHSGGINNFGTAAKVVVVRLQQHQQQQ